MSSKPYPSQTQDRYIVRFPEGMRDRIAEAAKAAGRSMNAEIISRLEESFDKPKVTLTDDQASGLADQIMTMLRAKMIASGLFSPPEQVSLMDFFPASKKKAKRHG